MDSKEYIEFRSSVQKVNGPRVHKVRNSYGIHDGYRFYRKIKPKDKKYVLIDSQYLAITRRVNNLLAEAILRGEDIILPEGFGRLEIRKYKPSLSINSNGKVRTTLPIDWDRTLRLWYEDKEAFDNKMLVRIESREVFKVYYNRGLAKFPNKSFYQFDINRNIKRDLKNSIKRGLDAFNIK